MSNSPAKKHFDEKAGAEQPAPVAQSDNQKKQHCPFKHKAWLIVAYVLLLIVNIAGAIQCH